MQILDVLEADPEADDPPDASQIAATGRAVRGDGEAFKAAPNE
jgi:hypothetical protein